MASSSSSPISFCLVGYNSDSSGEVEEQQQIAAAANSSLPEVPQPSPDPGEGCSGVAQEALEDIEEPEVFQPDCKEPLAQPYPADITQPSPELRSFLAAVRTFHTQKVNRPTSKSSAELIDLCQGSRTSAV